MKKILAILLFSLSIHWLHAQACCSGGSPISSNIRLNQIDTSNISIGFTYEYNFLKDLVNGTQKLEDSNRSRVNHAYFTNLRVNVNPKLNVSVLLPFLTQIENVFSQNEITFSRSVSGISDVVFLFQQELYKKKNTQIYGGLGIKLPTGTNTRLRENGVLLAADLQPGTGSWDFIPAIQIYQQNILGPFWDFAFSASYRMTTVADRLNGTQKYQFGNELLIRGGPYHDLFLFEKLSKLGLQFGLRNTLADQTNDFDTPNTSGTWFNFIPSFQYYVSKNLNVVLNGEVPLSRNLRGTQLTTSYRIGISFNYVIY